MRRWWRAQERTTKALLVGLVSVLTILAGIRIVGLVSGAPDETGWTEPNNSGAVNEEVVACPPDKELLEDFPGDTAHGQVCVGNFIFYWLVPASVGGEGEPVLVERIDGYKLSGRLVIFSANGVFCDVYQQDLPRYPRKILELIGCQHWGKQAPEGGPHRAVLREHRAFFQALWTGDTAKVCSMLGPKALAAVENGIPESYLDRPRPCRQSQARIENMLQFVVTAAESPELEKFVQATDKRATTGAPREPGAAPDVVLQWQSTGSPPVWKVAWMSCSAGRC